MNRYIEAPRRWAGHAGVFLAGGITDCPDWQQEAKATLLDQDDRLTVLNPRRANFPIHDPTAAVAQIEWEFTHLHRAAVVLFWFPESSSPQPIALYELGRHVALGTAVAVGLDPAYSRRVDVEQQLAHALPGRELWYDLRLTCAAAARLARGLPG